MKLLARLKRHVWLPCAALATGALATPTLHATTPALSYYPSEVIALPAVAGVSSSPQPVALAMNDQGYVLVGDTNPYDQRGPAVYFNHHLYAINLSNYAVGSLGASCLSNVAADGSFWVAGTYNNSTDGTTHTVRWQVFADGTCSAPDVTINRVLPPDSQRPGEQSESRPVAIDSAGLVVGEGQSYLVDVPMQWLPGDDTSHDIPGQAYPGAVSGEDDQGNALGVAPQADETLAPVYAGQVLAIPTVNNSWGLSSVTGSKVVGNHQIANAGAGTSVAFVYDVPTGVTTDLPAVASRNGGAPYHNDIAARINASGDVIGQGASDLMHVLWKYDPTADAYTSYREDSDLAPLALSGTSFQYTGSDSDYGLTGIATDGTLAMSYAQSYNSAVQQEQYMIVLFKPGPDPRPVINPTDPTIPNQVAIHTEPGQAFSYQLTATNNPTAFTLTAENEDGSSTLPAGISFNAATGVISGTGPANGVYSFAVTATNGQGYGAFNAGVELSSGDAPVVADQAVSAHLNQAFTYQVKVTPASASLYVYLTGTFPTGVSFNQSTGLLSGTPTQAGTFPLVINASNDIGQTTGNLSLTVDSKAPAGFTVSLIKPAANVNVVAGLPLTAKAKVDLTNAGSETVASLQFLLDGQPVGTPLTGKPYKLPVVIDGSLTGAHLLSAVATANDGRTATSAPITINVAAAFVDLTGTAALGTKLNAKGKLVITGSYTLSNLGNTAAGPFPIRFYLSNDAIFDPTDIALGPLVAQLTGKNTVPDLLIPGLPANTTISSSDVGSLLPAISVKVAAQAIASLNLSGKYVLAVIDPDNTAGEAASTRANNVIAIQIP